MLITREMDYTVRIVRALAGGQRSAAEIAQAEALPAAVTYKLLKRLTKAGLLESRRGPDGGYLLRRPCAELTLYDLFCAIDAEPTFTECLAPGYECPNNTAGACRVHREFGRVQRLVETELKRHTLAEIFFGTPRTLHITNTQP